MLQLIPTYATNLKEREKKELLQYFVLDLSKQVSPVFKLERKIELVSFPKPIRALCFSLLQLMPQTKRERKERI